MSTQTTFDSLIELPVPKAAPVEAVPKNARLEEAEAIMLDPKEAKRVNPYTAPTYEKFQMAFRRKYCRMPRAVEISNYYDEHPEEWERTHKTRWKRRQV